MNIQQALLCCSKISEMALTEEKARQGYHACGMDIARPFNFDKLLVERSQEIFGSLRAHASEAPSLECQNKRAFDCLSTMSPPKTKCAGCGHRMEVICKFCPECGQANKAFDESLHSVHHSKRRAGWKKNMDWAASKVPENRDEEELAAKVGDFLKKVCMRGKTNASSLVQEPQQKKNKVDTQVPTAASRQCADAAQDKPAQDEPSEAQESSSEEWNLNDPADCQAWIENHSRHLKSLHVASAST